MCISIRSAMVTLCPFLIAACLSHVSTVSADDLFSDVAMESVFRAEKETTTTSPLVRESVDDVQRVTGAGSLAHVLETAGLNPKKIDANVVSVTIRQAGWSFPVMMSVAVDQDRLDMVMVLTEVAEDSEWDISRLTQLFAANADESTVFFALSKSRQRIELRRSMSNRMITPVRLTDELLNLALVAERYEDTWTQVAKSTSGKTISNNAGDVSPPSTTATVVDATQVENPTPTTSDAVGTSNPLTLVGRWSATLSTGEAFAIQIAKDGKFQLVVAKAGKSSESTGTASRSGNTLTLADANGTKIVGTYQQTTADEFSLTLGSSSSTTLKFKRAKSS